MSEDNHSPEYYRGRFKKLIYSVGIILIIGTSVTFAADLLGVFDNFTHAIIFALSIAVIKASAVVAVFMHLWWDAKWKTISWTMLCTFFFFAGMMGLTVLGEQWDKPGNAEEFDKITGMPVEKDKGKEKKKDDSGD